MIIKETIYDWVYSYNGNNFEVLPKNIKKIPNTLFKYYALNSYSFDSLINQYIFAPHPSQLNDLFDCSPELLSIDKNEDLKKILQDFEYKNEKEIDDKLKFDYHKTKKQAESLFWERLYRIWGILSLTDNNKNILMWSYYSQHKGYCIEFDITKFPFKYHGPFPINYQENLQKIHVEKNGIALGILLQSNLKNIIWKHENEWRLMIEKNEGKYMDSPIDMPPLRMLVGQERKFYYPIEAIKSMSLGNRFFEYGEVNQLNSTEMVINLKSNFEQKSIILDFIYSNDLHTYIGFRNGLNEIHFRTFKIDRINYKEYKINAC